MLQFHDSNIFGPSRCAEVLFKKKHVNHVFKWVDGLTLSIRTKVSGSYTLTTPFHLMCSWLYVFQDTALWIYRYSMNNFEWHSIDNRVLIATDKRSACVRCAFNPPNCASPALTGDSCPLLAGNLVSAQDWWVLRSDCIVIFRAYVICRASKRDTAAS